MYCLKCGSQMAEGTKFCITCGAKMENDESVQTPAAQEAAVSVESSAAVAGESTYPKAPPQPVQQQPNPTAVNYSPAPPQPAQPVQQPQPAKASYPPAATQPVVPAKPEKITPLPVWKYIGIFLIMGIPILGLVMVFVWAFGSSFNRNTKNYARAVLITFLIFLLLSIVGYFTIWASVQEIINSVLPNSGLPITN